MGSDHAADVQRLSSFRQRDRDHSSTSPKRVDPEEDKKYVFSRSSNAIGQRKKFGRRWVRGNEIKVGPRHGKTRPARQVIMKLLAFVMVASAITFVTIDFSFASKMGYIQAGLKMVLRRMETNIWEGFVLFTVTYVVTTVFFVPGSVLTLGCGAIFAQSLGMIPGVLVGSLAVQLGASIGASISFLLARYLLFDTVQSWIHKYPKMKAFEKAMSTNGFTVLCLLRLSPVVPWGPLNWMIGVTTMKFRVYCLSHIAMIPDTVAWVYIGAGLGSFAPINKGGATESTKDAPGAEAAQHRAHWAITAVGLVFTVIGVMVLTRYANAVLQRTVDDAADGLSDAEEGEMDDGVNPLVGEAAGGALGMGLELGTVPGALVGLQGRRTSGAAAVEESKPEPP